jgi:hypothetical protein
MKRTKVSLAVLAVVFLAVMWVAADYNTCHTPLYLYRMEQVSNKMGFLPTEITAFTYTAEYGFYQHCTIPGTHDKMQYTTTEMTCIPFTCEVTCPDTCPITCDDPTCILTCEATHWYTCEQTCPDTCEHTCRYTCEKPCIP